MPGDAPAGAPLPDVEPPPAAPATPPWRRALPWWLVGLVVLADQASKAVVSATLAPFASTPVIPGFVDLVHVRNTGVAFGLLNDVAVPFKTAVTSALALAALAGITYYARQIRREERLARVGLGAIVAGALGNLADRARLGYVIDFVDVHWRGWHFWAFNVADAAISIGAVLVFLDLLVVSRHASRPV